MKLWKRLLVIGLLILALMGLASCDVYYRPDNSNYSYGTDGTILYHPDGTNWSIKIW